MPDMNDLPLEIIERISSEVDGASTADIHDPEYWESDNRVRSVGGTFMVVWSAKGMRGLC